MSSSHSTAAGFTLVLEQDPPASFRAELGQAINAFHGETVPFTSSRFGIRALDASGHLAGGVSGLISWGWLFIDALWVSPGQRGHGLGRRLLRQAEDHAAGAGCHGVWLDTFQARGFYEALGYHVFGVLEDYPGQQSRAFLRKRLTPAPDTAGG